MFAQRPVHCPALLTASFVQRRQRTNRTFH
jgi:hypothetical protein